VSEVIAIFLNLILFARTAAFFYSLLGLVSHYFWEGDSSVEISTRYTLLPKDQSLAWFLACSLESWVTLNFRHTSTNLGWMLPLY